MKLTRKFQTQLSGILDYVELLNDVNTDSVEPTAQVTGLSNVARDDAVAVRKLAKAQDLLACSPLKKINNQIKVKNVF